MSEYTDNLIVGQGLAGTTLAWSLLDCGQSVVLIDRGETATASRVSAGLVTPWTGRRMAQSDDYQDYWDTAVRFYRSIENRLKQRLFTEGPMVRVFVNRSEESVFYKRKAVAAEGALKSWSGKLQSNGPSYAGCCMQPAGRLDVRRYLQTSVDYFSQRGLWFRLNLDIPDGLLLQSDQVELPKLGLTAKRIIFCQGAAQNPWFEGVPNNASRGDVINVRLDDYVMQDVVHHSVWLAPERDGSITAGSTYDWEFADNAPTAKGRRQILKAMGRFIDGNIRVHRHAAAVRPTMKDYRPVIGRHGIHSSVYIFNGLGSRGVLTAPRLAEQLVEFLTGQRTKLPHQITPDRLRNEQWKESLTQVAQNRMASVLSHGDVVIDATVGNGFDTCFLSAHVGPAGHVYGFDIQHQAIQATQKRLNAAQLTNVKLLSYSHAEISRHVTTSVSGAMFNLGYLPRGDHSIVTQADSTITALKQLQQLLKPGGMITVLAYRGHEGGPEETGAVESWLQEQTECLVERIDSHQSRSTSPILFILVKRSQQTEK
ncbi:MAG: FAD-dependent oxidoreductase [Fuerstiella sp.]|nr:FAD-dependent oxidoreductase [Fuerstiella sp.]